MADPGGQGAGGRDDLAGTPAFAAAERVWDAHARGDAASPVDCETVARLRQPDLRGFFLTAGTFDRLVPLRALETLAAEFPDIDWAAYKAALEGFLGGPKDEPPLYLRNTAFPSQTSRQAVMATERFCTYQDRALIERDILVPGPSGGDRRRVRDCYEIFGRGVFFYGGPVSFYLMTAGAGHKATAIVLPALSLTIDLGAGLSSLLSPFNLATTFAAQLKRVATSPAAFVASMARDEATFVKDRIVLLAGQIANFAHHLWNFFSGFDRLIATGLIDTVDEVRSYGTQFFGTLDAIFPELTGKVVHGERCTLVCANEPFAGTELIFQPGGYFITQALKTRVLDHARRTSGIHDVSPAGGPVIWFGLRVGSRAWVDQEESIVALASTVVELAPDAEIVLDAFSYPVGIDRVSAKWASAITDLEQLAARIAARMPAGLRVTNLVGRKLDEAIVVADRTSIYIAPIGTTQHKVGWFSRGRGLIYSAPDIENTRLARRPGCWEAEGLQPADFLIGARASEGERRSLNDQRNNLDNISLDLDSIKQWLASALEGAKAV